MSDPYVNIRKRLATALHWIAASATVVLLADALTAFGRFPYLGAKIVLIATVLIFAAILFIRVLLGQREAAKRKLYLLASVVGGLFFYGLIYLGSAQTLAQLVLMFCICLAVPEHYQGPVATTRNEIWLLVGIRLGALAVFLIWHAFWVTIFVAPAMTVFANFVMTIVVIRQLGRLHNSLMCMVASSVAFAMAGVFTFAVPLIKASAGGRLEQLVVIGITLVCGSIVGFLFGAVSHLTAEPLRQRRHQPQLDETVSVESQILDNRLRSAGAIRQVPTAPDHAREEIDLVRASPILDRALEDKDAAVRGAAAGLLGKLDPTRQLNVEKLLKLAGDPDHPDVEGQVRDSLCRIAPHAVPQFANALGSSNAALREAVVYALREAGPAAAEAIPPLRTALGDASPAVRQKAAGSLARLGATDAQTLAALERAGDDSSLIVRLAAQKAIRELQVAATRTLAARPDPDLPQEPATK